MVRMQIIILFIYRLRYRVYKQCDTINVEIYVLWVPNSH